MEQKEIFQAVLIADNFTDDFSPYETVSLIPLVNVPLLDYALESLNRSGVEEVFLFVSSCIEQVKALVSEGKKQHKTWSINMNVEIVSSEGCRCFGDALRDLDAKGLIRGHFVLMGAGTVTNAKLEPIFEEHKNLCKTDKGAAMTVIYKRIPGNQPTGDEIMIATDSNTNRLLFHQKLKPHQKERRFNFPLEILQENSEIIVHHDLIDPQIAICAPSVLPLFADNFDFETRDDFIRGLLINEEILASTIYVKELPKQQYARKVTNWQSYHMVSDDVMNRWIGSNCQINHAFLFDGVEIQNNVTLEYCVIGKNSKIGKGSKIDQGTIVGDNCVIPPNTILSKTIARSTKPDEYDADDYEKLGEKLFVLKSEESVQVDSDDEEDPKIISTSVRMTQLESQFTESLYSSSSDDDDDEAPSPIQEDSNKPAKLFSGFEQLMKYFGPVVRNYIKGEAAMNDCLKAFEETFAQVPALKTRGHQLLHYFYDNEILSEDAITSWYENLDDESEAKTDSIAKFIKWLEDASEEEDSDD
uniref:Translation initiation factor eIF2B subunit epsilon n=1 Tax=Culicoides sonorensis TaxID=179676 RepID=A0A336KNH5_CULSO